MYVELSVIENDIKKRMDGLQRDTLSRPVHSRHYTIDHLMLASSWTLSSASVISYHTVVIPFVYTIV